ncbi:hypothetical protein AB0D38_02935 [Streptomyces sp. NPDC048279]|uniref:hypothetical protein n=1 Tax=Streptomyces sp. NPDC048279 TaxID=3154714 RepID=UPI003436189D
MKTRKAACAAVLIALTATLAACSSDSGSSADPAACKAAMTKQYTDSIAKGTAAPTGNRPAACNGVDDKTVQRYGSEILAKELPKAVESAVESAVPSSTDPDITPACRKWIEGELTDSSDSINATAGLKACPGMDNDQLNAAIQTVTDEMLHSATATP